MPVVENSYSAAVHEHRPEPEEVVWEGGLGPLSQLIAIFLCGALAFIDLYCTQPLLPLLARVFHANEAHVGTTISASTLGVAFSAIVLAAVGERLPRKRTILISMVALSAATMLTATATSLFTLAVWRLIQGLLTPGIFVLTIAYVTEEWPPALVPRVMSVYVAGTVFGGFVGRVSGGMVGADFGWRTVFIVLGVLGFVGAGGIFFGLHPESARTLSPPAGSRWRPLWANLRNPPLIATFVIGFCMLFTLVSVFSYITFYLASPPFNLSAQGLSWLFAVYLFGLMATLVLGTFVARIGLRVAMLGAVALCLSGVALTLVHSLWIVATGLAIASSGVFVAQVCANSFLREAAPAGARVSAAGIYICSYYIGGTVGGVLPGFLWKYAGWPGCAGLTSALLVLAGFMAFFGWRSKLAQTSQLPA